MGPGVPPGEHKKTACEECGELANARGWGNPACYVCAGVDSHCLPISQHMFGVLLQSRYPGCQSHSEESRTASKQSDELTADDFDNESVSRSESLNTINNVLNIWQAPA